MQINANEIHVWQASLVLTPEQEAAYLPLLNEEEQARANRFHFPIHKQRFIAARYTLRQILSKYLGTAADAIQFSYSDHGKPFLASANEINLQFNLAHSENEAAYALTCNDAIGIDIEFIQPSYNPDIIERFCSTAENTAFAALPESAKREQFYCLWSRKEAIIKAIGTGFSLPLNQFSLSIAPVIETIAVGDKNWTLVPLSLHADYQSTLAYQSSAKTPKIIKQMRY